MITEHNVYDLLVEHEFDSTIDRTINYIYRYFQIIPKYYLHSTDIRQIFLSMSVGSGKSIAGILCAQENINTQKMLRFNQKFMPNSKTTKSFPSTIIVGSWTTQKTMISEMTSHYELGIVSFEEIQRIKRLSQSILESDQQLSASLQNKLEKEINKYCMLIGYQKLFNLVFPTATIIQQDIDALIQEYNQNRLQPDENFLNDIRGSVIIIDECQRLYSIHGLNTYGFVISYLCKLSKELDLKFVFMSGTILNSSVVEIVDILNFITPEKELINRENYCYKSTILENEQIWKIKKESEKEIIDLLKDHMMFYDKNKNIKSCKPTIKKISEMPKTFYLPDKIQATMCQVYSKIEMMPQEIHVGNTLVENEILLYGVQATGYQLEKYNQFVKEIVDEDNYEENENIVSIYDAAIPEQKKWAEYGIYRQGDIFGGKFLSLDNLKQFSAIGAEMCRICLENSFNGEKTAIYHRKLKNFGINQYAAILQHNGFCMYGNAPNKNSICKNCRKTYELHSLQIKDKIKQKVCQNFTAMNYAILTGELTDDEKDVLAGKIYRNPNNLHGDIISVIFLSDVAYAGVNIFSTQNLMILSKIPNISKWKQIYARIIRTGSHIQFEEEKRYAKIYTFILQEDNKQKSQTINEKYYAKNIIMNKDINTFLDKLEQDSVSTKIFSSKYEPSEEESKTLKTLLYSDLEQEINIIIRRVMTDKYNQIWEENSLVKRLMNEHSLVTWINLSMINSNLLYGLLKKNPMINSLNFNGIQLFELNTPRTTSSTNMFNSITFNQFNQIVNQRGVISNLFKKLSMTKSQKDTLSTLSELMIKIVPKDTNMLVDNKMFWNLIYDLGDEWYEDDDVNFFKNHIEKNRNKTKLAGMYYGNYIIKTNGELMMLPLKYVQYEGKKDNPYIFRITSIPEQGIIGSSSIWYLNIKIIKKDTSIIKVSDDTDKRVISRGIACTSFDISNLFEYFPKIDKTLKKKIYCAKLLPLLCEMQLSDMNTRFVYSPFEMM